MRVADDEWGGIGPVLTLLTVCPLWIPRFEVPAWLDSVSGAGYIQRKGRELSAMGRSMGRQVREQGRQDMAVTSEELTNAGASPELAKLLVRELRRNDRMAGQSPRGDLTRNPMAVGLVLAFLGAWAWLAVGITGTQTDVAVLQNDVAVLQSDVKLIRNDVEVLQNDVKLIRNDVSLLREGQARLEGNIAEILRKLN